ncbi:uncharacterized protein EKO05_0007168 [Ascochyta rabiei]|uniref:uncharacterized protein n=1 Tax=Didymella rabiei TaxID=5454 RepID=UPI00220DE9A4|nr:uncharacterized protein EKO05_0007168 [Ascochyta rabiei]UPX16782.1 hypothetical protein EKO05_0007168 [Ascochyta rabiei]
MPPLGLNHTISAFLFEGNMYEPIQTKHDSHNFKYDAITKQNHLASPLLRLPAELRNRIYELAFDSATVKRDLNPCAAKRYHVVFNSARLLLACRQLRYEAFPIQSSAVYHHLTLRTHGKDISCLVDSIGQTVCAEIRCIEMFMSLARSIHRKVKQQSSLEPDISAWSDGTGRVFESLSRIVVIFPFDLDSDANDIGTSLQKRFGSMEIKVRFRRAAYW